MDFLGGLLAYQRDGRGQLSKAGVTQYLTDLRTDAAPVTVYAWWRLISSPFAPYILQECRARKLHRLPVSVLQLSRIAGRYQLSVHLKLVAVVRDSLDHMRTGCLAPDRAVSGLDTDAPWFVLIWDALIQEAVNTGAEVSEVRANELAAAVYNHWAIHRVLQADQPKNKGRAAPARTLLPGVPPCFYVTDKAYTELIRRCEARTLLDSWDMKFPKTGVPAILVYEPGIRTLKEKTEAWRCVLLSIDSTVSASTYTD